MNHVSMDSSFESLDMICFDLIHDAVFKRFDLRIQFVNKKIQKSLIRLEL